MLHKLKDKKGFTLIEIVLVLAIAGLIMVVVFLAVAGAQKARRDTQRKDALSKVAAQMEQYASNNNGAYPGGQPAFNTQMTGNYALGANDTDPLSGQAYTYGGLVTPPTTGTSAGFSYALAGRTYTICVGLEQGTKACRTNQ